MAKDKKPQNRGLMLAAALGGLFIFGYAAMTQWGGDGDAVVASEHPLDRFEHVTAAANALSSLAASDTPPAAQASPQPEPEAVDPVDVQTRAYAAKGAIVGVPSGLTSNSFMLEGKRYVLYGILVPHPDIPCVTTGQAWSCGTESGKALKQLIGKHEVACIATAFNQIGETVAKCFVGQRNLSASMVNAGWALADQEVTRDYVSQQIDARAYKKGFWTAEFDPSTFVSAYH